jgi:hypothetical protein
VSHLRLLAHNLKVEIDCWQEHASNDCDECGCKDVQDEKLVLFYCDWEQVCELCNDYADLLKGHFLPMQSFSRSPSLSAIHHVSNRDIVDFFAQRTSDFTNVWQRWCKIFMANKVSLFFISLPSSHSIWAEGLFLV